MWFPLQLLATMFWASVNVVDSVIVQHYEKRPFVLQWYQGLFTLSGLLVIFVVWPVTTTVWPWLLLAGCIAYLGDAALFYALSHIDVSLSNIAWALQAILLSAVGFAFFDERWTAFQLSGVVFVLLGTILVSVWQAKRMDPKFLWLLPSVAVLHAPFFATQKLAVDTGSGVVAALFWSLIGREILACVVPLLIPSLRRVILTTPARRRAGFHGWNALVVAVFFIAVALTTASFNAGPVSLVSIVGNTQPFFVILIAWALVSVLPQRGAKEHLAGRSIVVKVACFALVFAGLALLGFSQ